MKKFIALSALCSTLISPAFASDKTGNIGVNVSLDSVLGIQGEFNVYKQLSVQIFVKQYTKSYAYSNGQGNYNYDFTAIGAAAIYDFAKDFKISNNKIHPYGGVGLYNVNANFRGPGATVNSPVNGGLYFTAGLRYEIAQRVDLDGNYNNFGGVTIGANWKF